MMKVIKLDANTAIYDGVKYVDGLIPLEDQKTDIVDIKVHFSSLAGSDQQVIKRIGYAINHKQPFGLKCQASMIVYIPHELRCYWIGKSEASFEFKSFEALAQSAAMQYLTHKEFVSTSKLLKIAKYLKCQNQESTSRLIT